MKTYKICIIITAVFLVTGVNAALSGISYQSPFFYGRASENNPISSHTSSTIKANHVKRNKIIFSDEILTQETQDIKANKQDKLNSKLQTFETWNPETKSLKTKNQETKIKRKQPKFVFLGFGTINFGNVTYYPYKPIPEGEDPSLYSNAFGPNPAEPYDFSYSSGICIDYKVMDFLVVFLDGGYNSWKLKLGNKDGYSYGQWVAEATDWNTAVVGPLVMDTYYYMDCTSFRIGARYIIFSGKPFQPWAGAGVGLYAWQATIGNKKESLKSGSPDSGLAFGYSFLAGIDIVISDFILRVFLDYGSAIAHPEITGLLSNYPDAVFENTGGEHVTGPYKIGAAIGIKY